jgi:hypothetical protein
VKIFVPVESIRSWQERFFVYAKFERTRSCRQAVAVAPDQRHSRTTNTPKNTVQRRFFSLWILWKTAKATKRVLATLSAAVYTQNPQPLRLITTIDNSKFFALAVGIPNAVLGYFFIVKTQNAGRAHLHIPSECRIPDKPRGICCFESFFKQEVP